MLSCKVDGPQLAVVDPAENFVLAYTAQQFSDLRWAVKFSFDRSRHEKTPSYCVQRDNTNEGNRKFIEAKSKTTIAGHLR